MNKPHWKKGKSPHYFNDKKSNIFELRKEVTNWILDCETRISDHLERLLDK